MNKIYTSLLFIFLSSLQAYADNVVNIYSQRQPFLIEPILEQFTKDTNIKTAVIFAKKGLIQRIKAEGVASPADVVLSVDMSSVGRLAAEGLTQSINSPILNENVPSNLRAANNSWFALTKRLRIIAVAKDNAAANTIATYEELADKKWQGSICTRPGSHVYNRGLLTSMIAAHGFDGAKDWANGLVANLARKPQGNDRAQIKAIFEGQCSIAIMNHYYYGKMQHAKEQQQQDWANAINIIFPNQQDRGTHVNISAGAVAKYSPNKENAIRLLEYLSSEKAQQLYATLNYEYPVNPNMQDFKLDFIEQEQHIKEDGADIEQLYTLAPEAQKIIDITGW